MQAVIIYVFGKTGGLTKERLEGNIEFNNVSFHYPTRENVPILKNLSVTVRPGQKIAFVGYAIIGDNYAARPLIFVIDLLDLENLHL